MFILTTVVDTIRIAAHNLAVPTKTAVQDEMDRRYPNRVLMDVGLVISRYGDCLRIGDGSCVEGDGGAHHECLVKLVIFRPFVDEVCTGRIIKSEYTIVFCHSKHCTEQTILLWNFRRPDRRFLG